MRILFLLIILALAGCASTVGWGKKYEVVHSNSQSITVKYDSILADFKDFAPEVDAHCAKYGKEAVPAGREDNQSETIYGGIQTFTFLCK